MNADRDGGEAVLALILALVIVWIVLGPPPPGPAQIACFTSLRTTRPMVRGAGTPPE